MGYLSITETTITSGDHSTRQSHTTTYVVPRRQYNHVQSSEEIDNPRSPVNAPNHLSNDYFSYAISVVRRAVDLVEELPKELHTPVTLRLFDLLKSNLSTAEAIHHPNSAFSHDAANSRSPGSVTGDSRSPTPELILPEPRLPPGGWDQEGNPIFEISTEAEPAQSDLHNNELAPAEATLPKSLSSEDGQLELGVDRTVRGERGVTDSAPSPTLSSRLNTQESAITSPDALQQEVPGSAASGLSVHTTRPQNHFPNNTTHIDSTFPNSLDEAGPVDQAPNMVAEVEQAASASAMPVPSGATPSRNSSSQNLYTHIPNQSASSQTISTQETSTQNTPTQNTSTQSTPTPTCCAAHASGQRGPIILEKQCIFADCEAKA